MVLRKENLQTSADPDAPTPLDSALNDIVFALQAGLDETRGSASYQLEQDRTRSRNRKRSETDPYMSPVEGNDTAVQQAIKRKATFAQHGLDHTSTPQEITAAIKSQSIPAVRLPLSQTSRHASKAPHTVKAPIPSFFDKKPEIEQPATTVVIEEKSGYKGKSYIDILKGRGGFLRPLNKAYKGRDIKRSMFNEVLEKPEGLLKRAFRSSKKLLGRFSPWRSK